MRTSLIDTCGSLLAGRCICAATNTLLGDPELGAFFEFAIGNVDAIRDMIEENLANASHLIDEWCIDIDSAAHHAAAQRHLQWLGPTREAFCGAFASRCLRTFHEIWKSMQRDPAMRALAWPHSFRFVDNGDAWLLWQPGMLLPQRILPGPHTPP